MVARKEVVAKVKVKVGVDLVDPADLRVDRERHMELLNNKLLQEAMELLNNKLLQEATELLNNRPLQGATEHPNDHHPI